MIRKAIGYIRVSTGRQSNEGHSLEAQEARIKAWCEMKGFELIGIEMDAGLSGGKAYNRPGLQAALTIACQEGAALVVYSLSRLARSTRDAIDISERLDKAGADLVSISEQIDTTSAAGRMIFQMMSVLAEFERSQISERVTEMMTHLRKQDRRISRRIPYGYDLDEDGKTLIENASEQATISLIKDLKGNGHSLRNIASELKSRGICSKNGKSWSAKVIRGILIRDDKINNSQDTGRKVEAAA